MMSRVHGYDGRMNLLFFLLLLIVVLAIGGVIVSSLIWLLWWIVIGLVIGGLSRLLVSRTDGIGMFATILAGITGSLAGGIIASIADLGGILRFVVALLVSAVLVAIMSRSGSNPTS